MLHPGFCNWIKHSLRLPSKNCSHSQHRPLIRSHSHNICHSTSSFPISLYPATRRLYTIPVLTKCQLTCVVWCLLDCGTANPIWVVRPHWRGIIPLYLVLVFVVLLDPTGMNSQPYTRQRNYTTLAHNCSAQTHENYFIDQLFSANWRKENRIPL